MVATRNSKSPDTLTSLRQLLQARLADWLAPRQLAGAAVAVGFSGGRDSLALLDALSAIAPTHGISLSAVHVHHGLSPNADRWVALAENFCKLRAIPLLVVPVSVARHSGAGLEAAARAARYAAFAHMPVDLLLLGHHRDDQAETLLFNLLRGAGVRGAAAMPMLRSLPRTGSERPSFLKVGRPWLDVSRAEIDRYVNAAGLEPVDDESNLDPSFSRNFLRHAVMPGLAGRFPGAASSLAAAARRFGEAAELLDQLAELDLKDVGAGASLDCVRLSELDPARQKNLLRYWIERQGGKVASEVKLIEFLRQIRDAADDATLLAHFGRLALRRWRGRVYGLVETVERPAALVWEAQPRIPWAGGSIFLRTVPPEVEGLRTALLAGQVEIRPRAGGESLRLREGGATRPLRLLFQERNIPPWERLRLPYLWIDGHLAAVGGIGIDVAFRAQRDEPATSFEWSGGASPV